MGSFEGHRPVGDRATAPYQRIWYLPRRFSGLRCAFSANWYTKVFADGRLRSLAARSTKKRLESKERCGSVLFRTSGGDQL